MRTPAPSRPRSARAFLVSTTLLVALAAAACGEGARSKGATEEATTTSAAPGVAPHGGMLVPVGKGVAQLEFVVDTIKGIITVHVYDGSAREPLRLTQLRIDLTMLDLLDDESEVSTVLSARANPETGETFDHTSVFLGFVPQLVGRGHFRARVQRLEVGGQVFTDIPVSYPAAATA